MKTFIEALAEQTGMSPDQARIAFSAAVSRADVVRSVSMGEVLGELPKQKRSFRGLTPEVREQLRALRPRRLARASKEVHG